jgi:type II secretory pathway predicted ATPase ExeA
MAMDFMPEDSAGALDTEIGQIVDSTHGDGGREQVPEISSDPLKHFGLNARPFADCVNPEFFYRTEAHEEAFIAMKRCIDEHVAIGLTTAISGTGKTLLTQVLIQELDPRRYQPILVLAYPGMSRSALLREIAGELNLDDQLPARPTTHSLITKIQGHIIQLYLKGVRLVLIIDEVHFLGADSLHILRTLSNIEVPEQKLVSVLLFGEQSFLSREKNQTFRSVFSRMFVRTEIRPLRADEIRQYIKFRLLMAGGNPQLFSDDAMGPLLELTGGIPREINRVCHNALVLAARRGDRGVDAETIHLLKQSRRI